MINPNSKYPLQTTAPSASYPYGGPQDVSIPGDGTGTPYEAGSILGDTMGFFQKLVDAAGITPSGNVETVLASDLYDALLVIVGGTALPSGTIQLFGQASAPVGWTKLLVADGWADNAMLNINTQADGTALASGGTANPQAGHVHDMSSHVHTMPSHIHGAGSLKFQTGRTQAPRLYMYDSAGSEVEVITSSLVPNAPDETSVAAVLGAANLYTTGGSGSTSSTDPGDTDSTSLGNSGSNTTPIYQEIIACSKD